MTCTLILMRHSHAADEHSCRDFDRQLTDAGIQLANATGKLLNELVSSPDLIVTSAAIRTVQTGDCLEAQFESKIPTIPRQDLYQAGPSAYLPAIQAEATADVSTVLAIGHNPGIGLMISDLAGQHLAVPPGTAAVYSINTRDWFELPSLNRQTSQLTHLIVGAKLNSDL